MPVEKPEQEPKLTILEWTVAVAVSVAVGVATTVANVALDTFVFLKVWAWLIVPGFGAPMIGWKAAAGVSLLVAITSHQALPEQPLKRLLGHAFLVPPLALLTAWVITKL